jgi:hypothetical protein
LFGCLVVWLFGCLVVWLFGCLVVWLFGCLVVWLCGCVVVGCWLLVVARCAAAQFLAVYAEALCLCGVEAGRGEVRAAGCAGRGQEVAGEDPTLLAEYIYEYASGMQQGPDTRCIKVVSTSKHFRCVPGACAGAASRNTTFPPSRPAPPCLKSCVEGVWFLPHLPHARCRPPRARLSIV